MNGRNSVGKAPGGCCLDMSDGLNEGEALYPLSP